MKFVEKMLLIKEFIVMIVQIIICGVLIFIGIQLYNVYQQIKTLPEDIKTELVSKVDGVKDSAKEATDKAGDVVGDSIKGWKGLIEDITNKDNSSDSKEE